MKIAIAIGRGSCSALARSLSLLTFASEFNWSVTWREKKKKTTTFRFSSSPKSLRVKEEEEEEEEESLAATAAQLSWLTTRSPRGCSRRRPSGTHAASWTRSLPPPPPSPGEKRWRRRRQRRTGQLVSFSQCKFRQQAECQGLRGGFVRAAYPNELELDERATEQNQRQRLVGLK